MENIQLVQALLQLQAMKSLTSSSLGDDSSSDGSDFSSLLETILQGNDGQTSTLLPGDSELPGMTGLSANPLNSAPYVKLNLGMQPISMQALSQPTTEKLSGSTDYDQYIDQAAKTYGVDPKLIRSIIQHESGFNPNSRSQAGALGLMQLMPQTAASLGVTNPLDPEQNILGGTKYIKELLDRFNNNKTLAVAAYNAGPGNVQKYDGIPPFSETQNYVKNVLSTYYS
ncbi:hypothetical protein GCM10011391_32600 [Pullulanibacillus camelliae]|uniref:Transglycosylase SLT domain-containing protein n=1 Tax=Pullulanibacillus camelliae TaxID=1707096 RepID=A0A8J2YL86_9BACL|nr:lytic transglycosylase domain-containing protein [Pullulanibacillus camelliae]GGE51288.1 hypothetical protein GCM10011391_32600 [Pullulanibacillus camelliae]